MEDIRDPEQAERLAAAAHGSGDPEQTVTAILDALRSAEPEDDTCLVALQIL